MKITLKIPMAHDDAFWPAGATLEAEENFAKYSIGTGDATAAAKDAKLSDRPEPAPARRSIETDAMEKAAASIVGAVAKASLRGTPPGKGKGKGDDELS